MNTYSLSSKTSANSKVISFPEKLVMANSDDVGQQLTALINEGVTRLVIDLQPVQFMDSSGLAVLVSAWKKVKPAGGKVVLVYPAPSVRALLELTRLHEIFDIYEDLDAAQEFAVA